MPGRILLLFCSVPHFQHSVVNQHRGPVNAEIIPAAFRWRLQNWPAKSFPLFSCPIHCEKQIAVVAIGAIRISRINCIVSSAWCVIMYIDVPYLISRLYKIRTGDCARPFDSIRRCTIFYLVILAIPSRIPRIHIPHHIGAIWQNLNRRR